MLSARTARCTIVVLALTATAQAAFAAAPAGGLVSGGASATFRFLSAVKTPKGTHTGGGTIIVKRGAGDREVDLTVQPDDGKPAHTIALIVGADGSVVPDSSDAPSPADPAAKAQAAALMSEMTIAAHVGIGARKNAGASSYAVPVDLSPVGNGTPVSTQLRMTGGASQYIGATLGQTQTKLPQGGSLDPAEIAKTIGISAFAHRAFSPAGRAATAIVMHRKRKDEKAAASGLLPDAMQLTVTAELADGKIHEIRGVQTDDVTLSGKAVRIESTWTFTKIPG